MALDLRGIGPTEALLPRLHMVTLLLYLCIYRGRLAYQIGPRERQAQWAVSHFSIDITSVCPATDSNVGGIFGHKEEWLLFGRNSR